MGGSVPSQSGAANLSSIGVARGLDAGSVTATTAAPHVKIHRSAGGHQTMWTMSSQLGSTSSAIATQ